MYVESVYRDKHLWFNRTQEEVRKVSVYNTQLGNGPSSALGSNVLYKTLSTSEESCVLNVPWPNLRIVEDFFWPSLAGIYLGKERWTILDPRPHIIENSPTFSENLFR
jgi:hypothetical protein